MPPLIPAAKLLPVDPRTTTLPPVIYSQQWLPTPSTTAIAPLLRTPNRSPATPDIYISPLVAPYKTVFPIMMFLSGSKVDPSGGTTIILPPESPFPR